PGVDGSEEVADASASWAAGRAKGDTDPEAGGLPAPGSAAGTRPAGAGDTAEVDGAAAFGAGPGTVPDGAGAGAGRAARPDACTPAGSGAAGAVTAGTEISDGRPRGPSARPSSRLPSPRNTVGIRISTPSSAWYRRPRATAASPGRAPALR